MKIFIYILICFISLFKFNNDNISIAKVERKMSNNISNQLFNFNLDTSDFSSISKTGLGTGIDSITADGVQRSELKSGAPIFNQSWLNNITNNAIVEDGASSQSYSISGTSIEEIKMSLDSQYSFGVSATYGKKLFTGTLTSGFTASGALNYNNYLSHYFYNIHYYYDAYTCSLPNYSSNITEYKSNLHSDYVQAVSNLFNGIITSSQFFSTYGTHIIAAANYGGSVDIYYTLVSNKIDFSSTLYSNLSAEIGASFTKRINGSLSEDFSLESLYNVSRSDYSEILSVNQIGGAPSIILSYDTLASLADNWSQTIPNNTALISAKSDGLIPLWELLPSQFDDSGHKTIMKSMFADYANKNSPSVSQFNKQNLGSSFTTDFVLIRDSESGGEYYVADDNLFNNEYDVIDLNKTFSHSIDLISKAGFDMMDVRFSIRMKEKNMGYQQISLFKSSIQNNIYKIGTKEYEYGGSGLATKEYGESTIDTFNGISFTQIIDGKLYFRYGARGSGQNEWYNNDLYVQIIYYSSC